MCCGISIPPKKLIRLSANASLDKFNDKLQDVVIAGHYGYVLSAVIIRPQ
jgi:hypothetical protein